MPTARTQLPPVNVMFAVLGGANIPTMDGSPIGSDFFPSVFPSITAGAVQAVTRPAMVRVLAAARVLRVGWRLCSWLIWAGTVDPIG